MHIRTVLNKTVWLLSKSMSLFLAGCWESLSCNRFAGRDTCQATHVPVTCQAAHISIVGQLVEHRDVPQSQPRAPRRLPLCLCPFSGCKTSSHCLRQQVQTDPWNPPSVVWLIDSRRNVLLSFFLLPSFFFSALFHMWEGGILLNWFGLGHTVLTVNILWFISE